MGTGLNLLGCRKNGEEFPIEVGLTFVAGQDNLVVASVADLSERLALELEASRAAVRAAVASAAAGIAHDVRNPLNAIILRASALKSKSNDELTPTRVRREAEAILGQVHRAERIIGNLSVLAENGIKLEEKVDLNRLIQGAMLLVLEQAQKSGTRINSLLNPDLPDILGHSVALERVLMNILTNAIEAMPSGGLITITTVKGEKAVFVIIEDNGPGISPEAIEHVFDLNYTTKPGGTGLGLWLSRKIVEQHRGALRIKSELGIGTNMEISIPTGD
jgi:signal transduction histidine kinase